jgi:hypothetical protein
MVFPEEATDAASVLGGLVTALASQGLRTLVLAQAPVELDESDVLQERLPAPLRPVAVVTFRERVRPDAAQTLSHFHAQGVGVRIISGHGRLDGNGAVVVSTEAGGTDFDRVEAETLVVSVGASPRVLPDAQPDGERILTWTQLYNLAEVPEHIIVVGSGVTIGVNRKTTASRDDPEERLIEASDPGREHLPQHLGAAQRASGIVQPDDNHG